jgi:hypothetical protein
MRGRPFQPGNQFGRGRPKGSRNKKNLVLQELIDEHRPALARKALVLALQGDRVLLRMLLAADLPQTMDEPVNIGRLPVSTAEDLMNAHTRVINKVTAGEITPAQGEQLSGLLEKHRGFIETHDLAKRVGVVEQSHKNTSQF